MAAYYQGDSQYKVTDASPAKADFIKERPAGNSQRRLWVLLRHGLRRRHDSPPGARDAVAERNDTGCRWPSLRSPRLGVSPVPSGTARQRDDRPARHHWMGSLASG